MKYREKIALQKLQQQSIIIGNIISRLHNKSNRLSCGDILRTLQFSDLWEKILARTGHSEQQLLSIPISHFIIGLEKEVSQYISPEKIKSSPNIGASVSRSLLSRILNDSLNSNYKNMETLSVFQFELFLKHEQFFQNLIEELVEEGNTNFFFVF